ncbi:MAG: LPS export ABC transporter periplasmic protein LptC [Cyanobacteria bacterium CRU_2_1]|nr:LPS export ABC transporter periplasmic protein LptC [Cyanobacteria bacterium RU_5_0]NJR60841.1 LPS export ABC transporter periplasmic protein LptC [Cyanobacteria bacterium CRU_2_1]
MGWKKSVTLPLVLVALMMAIASCRQQESSRGAEKLAEDSSAAQNLDSNLTFNNLTLEQVDNQGETLWEVMAEQVTYSPDQKEAKVKNPDGDLYQDGEPVYHITAAEGDIRQDGDRIVLRGNVVATDLKSGAILRGDQLEWQPEKDLLVVKGNLQGTHPQLQLTANEARASNRRRTIEVSGQVEANTLEDPTLRLFGEHLTWRVDDQIVVSDRPIQVERIQGNQVTDQANGDLAEVNLANKTVKLTQNARVVATDPPLTITGNSLFWNVNEQTLLADQPVTVIQRQEQITLTANEGRMEFQPKMAYFIGNVNATGQRNQSQLTSDRLTWNVATQDVTAEGNVVYVQPDPPTSVKGPKAVGRLTEQTIVVSGGRVETQIVPQNLN